VPRDARPLPPLPEVDQLLERLQLKSGRKPGSRAGELVDGGYASIRVDLPDDLVLYANGQGGFHVTCPVSGDNVVPTFGRALTAWRAGGPRALECPACGATHALEHLEFAPPAVFGRGAIVLVDVADATVRDAARGQLEEALGPLDVIGARR